jgi:hypothetical protein
LQVAAPATEKVPGSQMRGRVDPEEHMLPAGHGEQLLVPSSSEYVPFWQGRQKALFDAEKVPSTQRSGSDDPGGQRNPASQVKHAEDSEIFENLPPGHWMHDVELPRENVPDEQLIGDWPYGQRYPLGQLVQEEAANSEKVPLEHDRQKFDPSLEYWPGAHGDGFSLPALHE